MPGIVTSQHVSMLLVRGIYACGISLAVLRRNALGEQMTKGKLCVHVCMSFVHRRRAGATKGP
jgi:hypothetical protein